MISKNVNNKKCAPKLASILPKTNLKMLIFALVYVAIGAEIFRSFFWRIEKTKKPFQNQLNFSGLSKNNNFQLSAFEF